MHESICVFATVQAMKYTITTYAIPLFSSLSFIIVWIELFIKWTIPTHALRLFFFCVYIILSFIFTSNVPSYRTELYSNIRRNTHTQLRIRIRTQRLLNANGKLDEEDRLWLGRLRGIMGVSQFEGERALESVTAPVYRWERRWQKTNSNNNKNERNRKSSQCNNEWHVWWYY